MTTRRRFLKAAGLAGVLSTEQIARAERAANTLPSLSQAPNIIVLMTDPGRPPVAAAVVTIVK